MRGISFAAFVSLILSFVAMPGIAEGGKVPDTKSMNRLGNSTSAYLRSASHQPVHWYEWGPEAFSTAKREDKPILLDIGAVWCHWCHVIDRESYENPEVAQIINESYIPVKVDVDVRPDIDRRYQEVVQALTGQGGWPLTVFLTPEGEVMTGGTYFPPEDRWGMPGMMSILRRVAEAYREQKTNVAAQAKRLTQELSEHSARSLQTADLHPSLLERVLTDIVNRFDEEHGGFGDAPKFPPPTALELFLRQYLKTGDKKYLSFVTKTLDGMAKGGMRDQLGGAFHRYSTDRFWRVPHFEVMLYVEAELMRSYALAYQVTQDPFYRQVLEELLGYLKAILSDSEKGGFYGSQDADYSPDDDGDYWTWSLTQAKDLLSPEEMKIAGRYFGIEEQGEMREDPAKNVLYEATPFESLTKLAGKPESDVRVILARAKEKLFAARNHRKAPFVDKTLYVNWNSLMISGMLSASVALEEAGAKALALKTLERIWNEGYSAKEGLFHVVQDKGAHTRAFLDDYAYLLNACLDAYEVTQDLKYLQRAEILATELLEHFQDKKQGGFFDTRANEKEAIVILRQRRKPIQDAPTPAANSMAALGFNRLFHVTGKPEYRKVAEDTLISFAGTAQEYGLFAASFGIALDSVLHEPVTVVIVGKQVDPKTKALAQAALSVYRPDRIIQRADPAAQVLTLPAPVRELLKNSGGIKEPTAFLCAGTQCAPPTTSSEQLKELLRTFGLAKADARS